MHRSKFLAGKLLCIRKWHSANWPLSAAPGGFGSPMALANMKLMKAPNCLTKGTLQLWNHQGQVVKWSSLCYKLFETVLTLQLNPA